MPELTLTDFMGRLPRRSDRLLPDNAAVFAQNVRLTSGELRGLKAPVSWHTFPIGTAPSMVSRVFNVNTNEFAWFTSGNSRTEIVKSPLVNDAFDRWYIFEPGQLPQVTQFNRIRDGLASYALQVPGPAGLPTLVASAGTATITEDRVYVFSFVSAWGEESAASRPRKTTVKTDGTVTVSALAASLPALDGRAYEFTRIYRSVIGGSTSSLRFVADIPFGNASYVDSLSNTEVSLNSAIPDYNDPPVSGLIGAKVHPSGSLVAFKGRQVYFSRAYLPHSWPEDWVISMSDPIVAIEVVGQNIMVLTKGSPVVLYGATAASMGREVFPYPLPCVGYRSVVNTKAGVYFASEDGLVLLTASGPQIITDAIMTREEWRKLCYDSDLQAIANETQYTALRDDGTGFVVDASGGAVQFMTLDGIVENASFYHDGYNGQPALVAGDRVYYWDHAQGEESDYRWRSKPFYTPKPGNFESFALELEPRLREYVPEGAMRDVFAYTGGIDKASQVVVRIFADSKLVHQGVVGNRTQVMLPRGFTASVWQVELEGQCRVYRAMMTSTGKGQERA